MATVAQTHPGRRIFMILRRRHVPQTSCCSWLAVTNGPPRVARAIGHVGEKKMVEASSKRYWWPSLTPDVLDFCRTCITCSSFKKPHPTATAPLQPMPTGFPGERVGIDIMGPLPLTKRGNRYILVMVNYFTKVAEAMKSQDAETVASTFFNRWICQHGVPESVHSDQGPSFESRLFTELCKTLGMAKTRTTPGHPQGNGNY